MIKTRTYEINNNIVTYIDKVNSIEQEVMYPKFAIDLMSTHIKRWTVRYDKDPYELIMEFVNEVLERCSIKIRSLLT